MITERQQEQAEKVKESAYRHTMIALTHHIDPQDLINILLVLSDDELQVITNFLKVAEITKPLIDKGIEFLANEAGDIAAKNYLNRMGHKND